MRSRLAVPQGKIREFCLRNHIRKLALFGSVLRDDFGPESDIDVLIPEQRFNMPKHDPTVRLMHMRDYVRKAMAAIVLPLATKQINS
jgi:predicted nucleotidyltransferase